MKKKKRKREEKDLARLARLVVHGEAPPEYESLVEALRELRLTFSSKTDSWAFRAVYRCLLGVKRVGERHWLVKGSKKLGDKYPYYNVWLTSNGTYRCDCYYRAWGRRRRKEICTHVAAVILHRRQRKLVEYAYEHKNSKNK